jgi:hypothetical protein
MRGLKSPGGKSPRSTDPATEARRPIDSALRIGTNYQTTYGTLWKDGTYFPRGTLVSVVGMHIEQGFCVRFPAEVEGEPLETWEDWTETDFLAPEGSIEVTPGVSASVLDEAREVLDDAEDGCHLHLHETDD